MRELIQVAHGQAAAGEDRAIRGHDLRHDMGDRAVKIRAVFRMVRDCKPGAPFYLLTPFYPSVVRSGHVVKLAGVH